MLVGRETEQAQIERLLADAREGRGRALVLRGEAGVGKTTLLEHAVEAANDFRGLHALGVESEAELPFAALHELLRPMLDLIDELPPPQANAIKAALALERIENPDRFSAYAATLGLLSAAAADKPLLCVVDDAHWLDQASAEALTFAARRLDYDPVAMLFAVRDPAPASFSAPGLDELRLRGLTADQARTLSQRAVAGEDRLRAGRVHHLGAASRAAAAELGGSSEPHGTAAVGSVGGRCLGRLPAGRTRRATRDVRTRHQAPSLAPRSTAEIRG